MAASAPRVYITRRETFSSAHRLHSRLLSDEENKEIFGKCNNPNGHGHNYVLEVVLAGPVDPKTGMVMNLTDLKRILHEEVISLVDHRNLDIDVEGLRDLPTTTENFAVWIWRQLQPRMQGLLYEVKLHETENNSVIYRGE
eukprot:TRINITY_DN5176_c0_g1_i1.p1 TRINITY_DN5176_c0_g1~~TRINITY_DN5176_c0_g1_i1.p1  ORF type:complete len:157 (+),score=40.53 TRINITY_DN5176_c0_g1_i1:49-471(+)